MRLLFIVSIFLNSILPCSGSRYAETESHFYYLDNQTLSQIERGTEATKVIPLKRHFSSVYAHKGKLYLSSGYGDNLYSCDPLTGQTTLLFKSSDKESRCSKCLFWDDFVILYSHYEGHLFKIPLKANTGQKELVLKGWLTRGYIYGSKGYFAHNYDEVFVVDLKTLEVERKIGVGHSPKHMLGIGDKLYVTCGECERVYYIDILTQQCLGNIVVERLPKSMVARDGFLYVSNKLSGSISKIDLKTHKVVQTFRITNGQESGLGHPFLIKGGIGYVLRGYGKEVVAVNLSNGQILFVIQTNTHYMSKRCKITDKAFYIYDKRICALLPDFYGLLNTSIPLFKSPFDVQGLSLEDGEEDFQNLLRAVEANNGTAARTHLISALRCGHPKAYALAAYAYLHELWGCEADLFLHVDYVRHADQSFYNELCALFHEQGQKNSGDSTKQSQDSTSHSVYPYAMFGYDLGGHDIF